MAQPRIGLFGALVAVGGVLAWRWAQKHRVAQANLNRDLSRWEGEGGAVAAQPQAAPAAASSAPHGAGAQRPGAPNGHGEPWPFPHG
jgi:hypothetical protein